MKIDLKILISFSIFILMAIGMYHFSDQISTSEIFTYIYLGVWISSLFYFAFGLTSIAFRRNLRP